LAPSAGPFLTVQPKLGGPADDDEEGEEEEESGAPAAAAARSNLASRLSYIN
jgi:hypothetical protein